jgi:AbrB family looped-hinge helix DNA binding protein
MHVMAGHARMEEVSKRFRTKSDKIRALSAAGYSRAEIAKFLGIRYQHVRNVQVQSQKKAGLDVGGSGVPGAQGTLPEGIRNRMRLKVDGNGRILIPAAVRDAMRVGEGGTVLAWLDNGELRLVSPHVALRQVQDLARKLIEGDDSLADELIAERRDETRRERKNG